jgi:uncharacterized protein
VTRRLSLTWADTRPFGDGRDAIRILAASDEPDPALDHESNREALGRIDLVVGCGDLSPERVAFLGDAFRAPLVYVRGNHDRGGAWATAANVPVESWGIDRRNLPGVALLGLPWPGIDGGSGLRDEAAAWGQVLRALKLRLLRPPARPWLVFSHAPPRGAGDAPDDPYHVGFAAYRAVLDRLAPRLWLHGHTTRASQRTPIVEHGPTTVINVTGSVLVELRPERPAAT